MTALVPFVLGYLAGRSQGGFHLFGSSYTPPRGKQAHHSHPAPIAQPEHAIPMSTTSTAVMWTSNVPEGLPPFPSGWRPTATTPAVISRASQLMGTLPVGETKYEHGGAGWLAFHASRENGMKYVTAWEPKGVVVPSPMSSVSPMGVPVVSPVVMQHPTRATIQEHSTGPDVAEWQRRIGVSPADGVFGRHTKAATVAWQLAHGLQGDGIVGPLSWAASDTAAA